MFAAAQMWTFVTLLPLFIGDLIPLEQPHWECFLLLLQIVKMPMQNELAGIYKMVQDLTSCIISCKMQDYKVCILARTHVIARLMPCKIEILYILHDACIYIRLLEFLRMICKNLQEYDINFFVLHTYIIHTSNGLGNFCLTIHK